MKSCLNDEVNGFIWRLQTLLCHSLPIQSHAEANYAYPCKERGVHAGNKISLRTAFWSTPKLWLKKEGQTHSSFNIYRGKVKWPENAEQNLATIEKKVTWKKVVKTYATYLQFWKSSGFRFFQWTFVMSLTKEGETAGGAILFSKFLRKLQCI